MMDSEIRSTAFAMPLTSLAYPAVGGGELFPEKLAQQTELAATRASRAQGGFVLALGLGKAAQDYLA